MQENFSIEETKAFNVGICAIFVFAALLFFMAFSGHDYKHVDENFYHINATVCCGTPACFFDHKGYCLSKNQMIRKVSRLLP